MNFDFSLQTIAATAPVWSAPVISIAGLLWIWWARHGIDRGHKVHCRACDFRGHPRLKVFPVRGTVSICPDCASESLIPVHPRGWLHHQEASPLAEVLQQVARRQAEQPSS